MLPSTISDRPRARVKRKVFLNQRRDEMARTCKHIMRHEHFRAKFRYVGVLSNAVFNYFPLEGFSQTNGNRLVSAEEPISVKTQHRQQPELLL